MPRPMRDKLTVIADFLDQVGQEVGSKDPRFAVASEYADDVREVLEPGGWTGLREDVGTFTTNVPLTVHVGLRDALKAAARGKNMSGLVTKGYREVLDGTFVPPVPTRARGLPGNRVVLNVTVDDELRKELRDRLPSLRTELGYAPKLTESWVAISILRDKLKVTDADVEAFAKAAAKGEPAE